MTLARPEGEVARANAERERRLTVEARAAVERTWRQTTEARIAAEQARRQAAEVQAEAERLARVDAQARAAAEQRRREIAEDALDAMRRSASWRIMRPWRIIGNLLRRHWGRALLETGLPLRQVERLAARFGYQIASDTAAPPPVNLAPAALPALPLPAQRIYSYLRTAAKLAEASHQTSAGDANDAADPRPRLAFVSPLPPQSTGIADYSAELLPELAKHYRIDLIVDSEAVEKGLHAGGNPVHDAAWLRENSHQLDRVLYHIGNSPFHRETLDLLEEVPGVAVLHDFYLGHLVANSEVARFAPNRWLQALYQSHGYTAVCDYYATRDPGEILFRYPVNHAVLETALGIIVHSESSRGMARDWYGAHSADGWKVIPHLRKLGRIAAKAQARSCLGLDAADFVVCSFGDVGRAKLNHRLLDAWFKSSLSFDPRAVLVFVGQIFNGEYDESLQATIERNGERARVMFVGRTEVAAYRHYLAAADIGVQLRALSRGETSGTVLDCLAHALPTIVNANGAMAELDPDAVWMLPNEFSDAALAEALEMLRQDPERRARIGDRARALVAAGHDPEQCGRLYAAAIEAFYQKEQDGLAAVTRHLQPLQPLREAACRQYALQLAPRLPADPPARRILLDISGTSRTDRKTGIERVARAIVLSLLKSPPAGYRIEPVYLTNEGGEWHYRCAIAYTLALLDQSPEGWDDAVMVPLAGDVLIALDLSGDRVVNAAESGLFEGLRAAGVASYCMVYDLLPIWMPQYFPPGAAIHHTRWLESIMRLDGAICISKSVADALQSWREQSGMADQRFKIAWSLLGADVANSGASFGMPDDAMQLCEQLAARPTFLMVGTIEPRKGHGQVIEALSRLWRAGHDVNLVIVGNRGWQDLAENMQRSIPQIVQRLTRHDERGRRLFWLEGISDEYLEKIYAAAHCMIVASENEGFGLPIIEAARHDVPIIARDIQVFREIAGGNAYYFSGLEPAALSDAIVAWLVQYESGTYPRSGGIAWLTWEQSARRLMQIVLENDFSTVVA